MVSGLSKSSSMVGSLSSMVSGLSKSSSMVGSGGSKVKSRSILLTSIVRLALSESVPSETNTEKTSESVAPESRDSSAFVSGR